jgi:hypothetical protein
MSFTAVGLETEPELTVSMRPSFAKKPLLVRSRRSRRVVLRSLQFPQPRGSYEYGVLVGTVVRFEKTCQRSRAS